MLSRPNASRRHAIALFALVVSVAVHLAVLVAPWSLRAPADAPPERPVAVTLVPPLAPPPETAPQRPATSTPAAVSERPQPRPPPAPRTARSSPPPPDGPRTAPDPPSATEADPAPEVAAAPPGAAPDAGRSASASMPGADERAADAPAPGSAPGPPVAASEAPSGQPALAEPLPPALAEPLPPAAVARLPERIELAFDAYLENLAGDTRIGTARFELRLEGGRYRMAIDARGPLATLAFESEGAFEPGGFRPERFSERRRVAFRRPVDRSVRYVPADASPVPAGPALAVPPGTQDRLSALFQLWLIARAAPAFPAPGHEIPMPLATLAKVHAARFRVGAPEPFLVDDRGVGAVRFTMLRDGPEPTIDVWLADDDQRLPVQLRYAEKNQAVRFVATGAR